MFAILFGPSWSIGVVNNALILHFIMDLGKFIGTGFEVVRIEIDVFHTPLNCNPKISIHVPHAYYECTSTH